MFPREYDYWRSRGSIARSRERLGLNDQRLWSVKESLDQEGVILPNHAVYAQNDAYLEMTNPGWEYQWKYAMAAATVLIFCPPAIWAWYSVAVHPLLFGTIVPFFSSLPYESDMAPLFWGGWLLFFPMAIGAATLLIIFFDHMAGRTAFFTYARGRIRFNRKTRQVYVLRPRCCGGNKMYDWDRLLAVLAPEGRAPKDRQILKALALYHPPANPADMSDEDEDVIFVGPTMPSYEYTAGLWEYIRLYMEEGPTVEYIPKNAPEGYRAIPRHLPPVYTTFCGMPSAEQYKLEMRPGVMETLYQKLSQATCRWPRFPAEWRSDSGIGEPEDRPVQTGAVMTAMVYRAKGELSKADELVFLRHWGTEEALARAIASP